MITAEGLQTLQAELAELEGEGRREIAERIKTAREWGDLKENSEYHDAKNDQAHLETKIARLRERISTAVVVEETAASRRRRGFGSTVVVRDAAGAERSWTDRLLARRLPAGGPPIGGFAGRSRAARTPRRRAGLGCAPPRGEPSEDPHRRIID